MIRVGGSRRAWCRGLDTGVEISRARKVGVNGFLLSRSFPAGVLQGLGLLQSPSIRSGSLPLKAFILAQFSQCGCGRSRSQRLQDCRISMRPNNLRRSRGRGLHPYLHHIIVTGIGHGHQIGTRKLEPIRKTCKTITSLPALSRTQLERHRKITK
jgi:hypothetical protein